MSTITEIRDKLVEIVEELAGAGQPLTQVYGRLKSSYNTNPTALLFPFAMVDVFEQSASERLDTASNLNTYSFIIRTVLRDKNKQEDADLRITIMEAFTDKLIENDVVDTLDGVVCKFDVVNITPFYDPDTYGQPIMGFDIIVNAAIIKSIT